MNNMLLFCLQKSTISIDMRSRATLLFSVAMNQMTLLTKYKSRQLQCE
jgi:hypothetical protein